MSKCPFPHNQSNVEGKGMNFSDIKSKVWNLLKHKKNKINIEDWFLEELLNDQGRLKILQSVLKLKTPIENIIEDENTTEEELFLMEKNNSMMRWYKDLEYFIELSWKVIEEVINGLIDDVNNEIENYSFEKGDIYFAVNQALDYLYKSLGWILDKVLTNPKNNKIYNISPWSEGYFTNILCEQWLNTTAEIMTGFIDELLKKWIKDKHEIEEIIHKNKFWIIDFARSHMLTSVIRKISSNDKAFLFDENNNLLFNVNEFQLNSIDMKKIEYQWCPMLYSKWGRYDKNNLIDFSTIMTKLILNWIDFEKIKESKIV